MNLFRRQLFIDAEVQGALLRRAGFYGFGCLGYFALIFFATELADDPYQPIGQALLRFLDDAVYWLPGITFMLPVLVFDVLQLSNRFTGPIYRLRREMERLVNGDEANEITFRDDDHWTGLAELYNSLRGELTELRQLKQDQDSAPKIMDTGESTDDTSDDTDAATGQQEPVLSASA